MTQYYGESESPQRSYQVEEAPLAPALRMVDWIIILVLCLIPVVNVVMLIIWALDAEGNPNRKNFSIAMLIMFGIEMFIFTLFFGYFTGMIFQVINAMQ
jgi:hypothetical protein